MGSSVMTQLAPGIQFGQHQYQQMMVDNHPHSTPGEAHHADVQPFQPRNNPSTPQDEDDPPPSPPLQPQDREVEMKDRDTTPAPQTTSDNQPSTSSTSRSQPEDTSQEQNVYHNSPQSPRLQPTYRSTRSLGGSEATSPSRIRVRDLSHIQSFASEEYLARPRLGTRASSIFSEPGRQYEISSMPVTDIIEMVAGLLTKITTTNDRQHEHLHRPIPPPEEQGNMSAQTSCVLAFHGKNVPSITILSYLSRIHKYCPTTYEVFLSLLVYFDRMTEMVNKGQLRSLQRRSADMSEVSTVSTKPTDSNESTSVGAGQSESGPSDEAGSEQQNSGHTNDMSQFFVVDSYNIHRLVIAGVTCASKFFSDVFYTNSRYAKVGGLPLNELNHLELQFLILNDFRLSVPVEELETYGTMLVEFYAREIVAQQQAAQRHAQDDHSHDGHGEGMYMRHAAGRSSAAQATAATS